VDAAVSTSAAFRPNTYVTILRTSPETLTDEYGDEMDNEVPVSTRNPFSIIMQSKRQYLPSENRTTIVQTHLGRCRANVDVKETDRLKDERTGFVYMIESIVHPQDPMGAAAKSFILRRVQTDNL
jgi:hypothetical protein